MRAEIIDRVLAVVDTQIITLSDVRAALRFGLVPPTSATDPIAAVLQRLIDRRLMLAEVDRYAPPEPTPAAVDARVAAIERRFKDALAFEIALNQSALSREELRRHLRDSLRIDTYLQQRFASAIQGPGDDVEAQRAAFVASVGGRAAAAWGGAVAVLAAVAASRSRSVRAAGVEGCVAAAAVQVLYLGK